MLPTYEKLLQITFEQLNQKTEETRLSEAQEFEAVYEGDLTSIIKIIEKDFKDKPFSKESLAKIYFVYRNVVQKIINKKYAGLFINHPVIGLKDDNGEVIEDKALPEVLNQLKFFEFVEDAVYKGDFFNTTHTLVYIAMENDKKVLYLENITPGQISVTSKGNYLKPYAIKIARAGISEDYYLIIKSDQYIYQDAIGNPRAKAKLEEDGIYNPDQSNPYGIIPVAIYRKSIGTTYFGEPHYALFTYQLMTILRYSDNIRGEFYNKFPFLHAHNFGEGLKNGFKSSPGELLETNDDPDNKGIAGLQAKMEFIQADVPWSDLRENMTSDRDNMMNDEGIPPASASVNGDAPKQIGAKTIDELEVIQNREKVKKKISDFMIELLEVIRIVHNYHSRDSKLGKIKEGNFFVEYPEEKPQETVLDKKARREMEVQYFISDPIDFVMEDKGLKTPEEAIKHIKERKERMNKLLSELGIDQQTGEKKTRTQQLLEDLNNNGIEDSEEKDEV